MVSIPPVPPVFSSVRRPFSLIRGRNIFLAEWAIPRRGSREACDRSSINAARRGGREREREGDKKETIRYREEIASSSSSLVRFFHRGRELSRRGETTDSRNQERREENFAIVSIIGERRSCGLEGRRDPLSFVGSVTLARNVREISF